jgi:hypothetical protein
MKSLFTAPLLLIDCGRASKQTRGISGAFAEAGSPPFNQQR